MSANALSFIPSLGETLYISRATTAIRITAQGQLLPPNSTLNAWTKLASSGLWVSLPFTTGPTSTDYWVDLPIEKETTTCLVTYRLEFSDGGIEWLGVQGQDAVIQVSQEYDHDVTLHPSTHFSQQFQTMKAFQSKSKNVIPEVPGIVAVHSDLLNATIESFDIAGNEIFVLGATSQKSSQSIINTSACPLYQSPQHSLAETADPKISIFAKLFHITCVMYSCILYLIFLPIFLLSKFWRSRFTINQDNVGEQTPLLITTPPPEYTLNGENQSPARMSLVVSPEKDIFAIVSKSTFDPSQIRLQTHDPVENIPLQALRQDQIWLLTCRKKDIAEKIVTIEFQH